MNRKINVCIPRMGAYSDIINSSLSSRWNTNSMPQITDRSTELGARYINELICLPAKTTLGGFIEACEKGTEHFLMVDSCGECRLKAYWILQDRVLKKLGYNATVHPVRLGWKTPHDIHVIDPSISYFRACWMLLSIIKKILDFDRHQTKVVEGNIKIGIVGEIYCMLEPVVNRQLKSKLEKLGAFVHISLPLSYFIFKRFYDLGLMKRKDMDEKLLKIARKKAKEYFPKEIGGHGNESVINTIYYTMKEYDGIIHVLPFPCMPESTVASVLDDICHESNVPLMRIILDMHTSDTGLNTRLEAFTDMLDSRKKRKERDKTSD